MPREGSCSLSLQPVGCTPTCSTDAGVHVTHCAGTWCELARPANQCAGPLHILIAAIITLPLLASSLRCVKCCVNELRFHEHTCRAAGYVEAVCSLLSVNCHHIFCFKREAVVKWRPQMTPIPTFPVFQWNERHALCFFFRACTTLASVTSVT